jgi:membrane-associated phospholipid phosphatase
MTLLNGLTDHFVEFFWGIGYFGWHISTVYALYACYSISWVYLVLYIFVFDISSIFNHLILKKYINDLRPDDPRPFLVSEQFRKRVNGMPSGHAQQTAFSLTFTYLISGQHLYASLFLFLFTIVQRYVFKNHTFLQLLVGTLLGVAIAYLTLHLEKIITEDPILFEPVIENDLLKNEPVNEPVIEPVNEPVNEPVIEPVKN